MVVRVGTTGLLRSFSLAEEDSSGLLLLSVGLAERLIGIAGKHVPPPPPKLPVENFVDSSYDGQLPFSYLRSEDFTYRRRKGELFDSGE